MKSHESRIRDRPGFYDAMVQDNTTSDPYHLANNAMAADDGFFNNRPFTYLRGITNDGVTGNLSLLIYKRPVFRVGR